MHPHFCPHSIMNKMYKINYHQHHWLQCWNIPKQHLLLKVGIYQNSAKSLYGRRVEPYILISIHGSFPGSLLHFQNPDSLSYVVYQHVHDQHGSATTSCTLYSESLDITLGTWSLRVISIPLGEGVGGTTIKKHPHNRKVPWNRTMGCLTLRILM